MLSRRSSALSRRRGVAPGGCPIASAMPSV
jgi:hypothetical protein